MNPRRNACLPLSLVLSLALGAAPLARAQKPPGEEPGLPPLPEGDGGRIGQLEQDLCGIRGEAQAIGGGRTIKESLDNVKTREHEVKDQIRRVDQAIEDLGGTQAELQAAADALGDRPLITFDDVPKEGAEKGVEAGAKEGLKRAGMKGLGRFLGWVSVIGDVAELAGRAIVRKLNVDDMKELVRQQQLTMSDVYDLAIYLRQEETRLREDKKKLEALREKERTTWNALAEERGRFRQGQGPAPRACDAADTRRAWDSAGDRGLQREEQKENKKKAKVTIAAAGGGALLVGGLLAAAGGGDSSGPANAPAPAPQAPAAPAPPPAAPPPPTGTLPAGLYAVNLVCIDNPRNHHEFVRADQVSHLDVGGVLAVLSGSAAGINFFGPAPWVGVGGEWDPATGRFTATGRGRVAGNPNIRTDFNGTLTPAGELEGDYVMGVGGGLPGGGTVTYKVRGRRN